MSTTLVTAAKHEGIDALALNYSKKRERVTALANALEDEVRAVYRRHRRALNEALATAEGAQAALRAEVAEHPELFEKPRTWALHGIKLGFQKGRGKVEWDLEDADLVERLRKRLGGDSAEFENCVEYVAKINVDGLRELATKDLAACGVTVEDTADVVVVKAVESVTDKLVKRLLKEGARGEEEGA
jgi:hypothetical protein